MKTKKYLLSTLSALFLLAFAQTASAHILFNYSTSEMNWASEKSYHQDGSSFGMDILWGTKFQFDVSFITPDLDFDLEEMEVRAWQFENPVISVSPSYPFETIDIGSSSFWLEAFKIDGNIYTEWWLTFDIVGTNVVNGKVSASIDSRGQWDYMALHVEDIHYTRYPFDGILDIDAKYEGEYNGEYSSEYPYFGRLFAKHVSVPEPLTPALLLTGLLGIFITRKIKKNLSMHKGANAKRRCYSSR